MVVQPTDGVYSFVVSDGAEFTNLDFDLQTITPPATVRGTVRLDGNPLGGVTVFADRDGDGLLGADEFYALTSPVIPFIPGSGGTYVIKVFPAGAAEIRIVNPVPGTIGIVLPASGFYSVVVSDEEVVSGLDFELETLPP